MLRQTLLRKKTQKYWLSKLTSFGFSDALIKVLTPYEGNTPSEKLLNYLFNIVSELMFASYKEQKEVKGFDINQLFADYSFVYPTLGGRTIHLETDIEDDTLGIKPKFVKKFLNTYGAEGLERLPGLFWAFNYYVPQTDWSRSYFDNESDAIDWNTISYEVLNEEALSNTLPEAFFYILKRLSQKSDLKADFKSQEFFLENPYLFPYFSKSREIKIQDLTDELNERGAKWRKIRGVTPQSLCMLFVNPEKFTPALLPVIEKLFGSKQIARLSPILQWKAAVLIESFGDLLLELPIEVFGKAYVYDAILGNDVKVANKDTINTYLSILPDQKLENAITLSRCASILGNISPEFIKKLKNIEASNYLIQALMSKEFQDYFMSNPEFMQFVMNKISPRDLKVINDYYSGIKLHILQTAHSIWRQRAKDKIVPLLKGKVGEYSWEIIDTENDASGLWLGNATDCCQAIENHARSCVAAGYIEKNCSFIAVRKDGKVYAQTFLWIDAEEKHLAAFDSIEMLSRSASQSPKIMKCFLQAAIALIETKTEDLDIRSVITGASGTTLPEGLGNYNLLNRLSENDCDEAVKKEISELCPSGERVSRLQRGIAPISASQVYTDCGRFFVLAMQNSKGKIYLSEKSEALLKKGK